MTYEKQEWIDEETVVTAAHMSHIEDGIEAVHASRGGVTFVNNSGIDVHNREALVPGGWEQVGSVETPIVATPEGFTVNAAGAFLVSLSGSYGNSGATGNYEYRVTRNGVRVLAFYGKDDVSSRSGTCVVPVEAGDTIAVEYYQSSGTTVPLRGNEFNAITFAQIA